MQTDEMQKMIFALTSGHHSNGDNLGSIGLKLIVAVHEGAGEGALVGSRVVVGDVEDEDRSILQVPGLLATIPVQALVETLVNDAALLVIIGVQLGEDYKKGERERLSTSSKKSSLRPHWCSCVLQDIFL